MQAVLGSRSIKSFDFSQLPLTDVISGGAKGIDTAVEQYCQANNIPFRKIVPDYARYGKAAPAIRTKEILDQVDVAYFIWDNKSRGTAIGIDYCKHRGIKHQVIVHIIPIIKNKTS